MTFAEWLRQDLARMLGQEPTPETLASSLHSLPRTREEGFLLMAVETPREYAGLLGAAHDARDFAHVCAAVTEHGLEQAARTCLGTACSKAWWLWRVHETSGERLAATSARVRRRVRETHAGPAELAAGTSVGEDDIRRWLAGKDCLTDGQLVELSYCMRGRTSQSNRCGDDDRHDG